MISTPTPRAAAPANHHRRTHRAPRRGFTLIEAAVCSVIVGLMMAAALNAAGVARSRQQNNTDRQTALSLAQTLMDEVLDRRYEDPTIPLLPGPELGEDQERRSTLDDVDDYDRMLENPPRETDGTIVGELNKSWMRSVSVGWVTSADPTVPSLVETGVKRVIVTIKKGDITLIELSGLRSKERDSW